MSNGSFSRAQLLTWAATARRWTLLVLVAGVPLLFLRVTQDPFEVPKLGFLIAGVGIAAAIRAIEWLQGSSPERLKQLMVPAACILIPLSLSWMFASYRGWSFLGEYKRFQGLLPYLVVVLLGILVADAFAGRLEELAWAFVVAGSMVGAYAVIQVVGLDPFDWGTTAGGQTIRTSTLGNPNFTGGFLALTLPIGLALWRQGQERSHLALWGCLIMLAGQVISVSAGGYAASVAGVAIFFGIVLVPRWSKAKLLAALIAAATATVVAGVVIAAMATRSGVFPTTVEHRGLWWQGALDMAADDPIIGSGPNTYAVDGVRYRPVADSVENGIDIADDVHSVPLSFLTSAGVLGLLGILAVAVWAFMRISRITPDDILRAGFAGAVIAYFVQSLVSIDEIALRVGFWAALAGSIVGPELVKVPMNQVRGKRKRVDDPIRAPLGAAAIAVVGLLCVWWGSRFVWSDVQVARGSASFLQGDPDTGRELYSSALGFRDEYAYRHFLGVYLGATAEQTDGHDDELIAEMDKAYAYLEDFPSLFALRDHASALAKLGEEDPSFHQLAAERYIRALELDPYNATIMGEGAPVLIDGGKEEELIAFLEPRIEALEGRVPELWAYLAIAYEEVGEHSEAVEALARAESLVPGSVPYTEALEAIR